MNKQSYQTLFQNKEEKEKWCIVDIDGVLNYYPACWLNFIGKETGKFFPDLSSAKRSVSYFDYRELKMKYRTCGIKRSLKVRCGAKHFLLNLRKYGFKVALVTARDVNYSYEDTYQWLLKNNLEYDKLVFDTKKHGKVFEMFPYAKFIVDDNTYVAKMFCKFRIKAYLFSNPQNSFYDIPEGVIKISNFEEILKETKEENE